jgi:hypothetical protein
MNPLREKKKGKENRIISQTIITFKTEKKGAQDGSTHYSTPYTQTQIV